MTEQEFQTQVWRPYDQITTANGVKGKVLNVCFTTKSVRAFISGAPEWIKCDLIETHTTGKGGDADDATIIEELHNTVLKQQDYIKRLTEEKKELAEKISKNYLAEILRAVNIVKEGLTEKKNKIAKIDNGLAVINDIVSNIKENQEKL